MIKRKFKN